MGKDAFHIATWGAAKRRPKSPCHSALAHGAAPVWGWPRKGSEGHPLQEVCQTTNIDRDTASGTELR
eukprot:9079809-Alexandrium_andersonii.AAC.1